MYSKTIANTFGLLILEKKKNVMNCLILKKSNEIEKKVAVRTLNIIDD